MMVSCPGCNNNYLVDERKLSGKSASLTCRECGKKWKVPAPSLTDAAAVPASPDAPSTTGSNAATGSSPANGSAAAAAPRGNDSSATLQAPVSCPKCGHFFVPYTARPTLVRQTPPAKDKQPASKILLVEDQKYFAELTCEALGDDCETTVTANLSAARNLIGAGGYDLVILDLSLEDGQDGTQVLQATRSLGIPVLIFTARDETELYGGVWEQLKAAGATDILIKGMNVGEELRQKVQSILKAPRKHA